MLTIKLSRIGKKKTPIYRIIISEKARDPYGNALEILGTYNPFTKELIAKNDRINYWISKGAQMTPTVNNLLVEKKVVKGEKVTASKAGKKKKSPSASSGQVNDKKSSKASSSPEKKPENSAPKTDTANKEPASPAKEESKTEEKKESDGKTPEKQAQEKK